MRVYVSHSGVRTNVQWFVVTPSGTDSAEAQADRLRAAGRTVIELDVEPTWVGPARRIEEES